MMIGSLKFVLRTFSAVIVCGTFALTTAHAAGEAKQPLYLFPQVLQGNGRDLMVLQGGCANKGAEPPDSSDALTKFTDPDAVLLREISGTTVKRSRSLAKAIEDGDVKLSGAADKASPGQIGYANVIVQIMNPEPDIQYQVEVCKGVVASRAEDERDAKERAKRLDTFKAAITLAETDLAAIAQACGQDSPAFQLLKHRVQSEIIWAATNGDISADADAVVSSAEKLLGDVLRPFKSRSPEVNSVMAMLLGAQAPLSARAQTYFKERLQLLAGHEVTEVEETLGAALIEWWFELGYPFNLSSATDRLRTFWLVRELRSARNSLNYEGLHLTSAIPLARPATITLNWGLEDEELRLRSVTVGELRQNVAEILSAAKSNNEFASAMKEMSRPTIARLLELKRRSDELANPSAVKVTEDKNGSLQFNGLNINDAISASAGTGKLPNEWRPLVQPNVVYDVSGVRPESLQKVPEKLLRLEENARGVKASRRLLGDPNPAKWKGNLKGLIHAGPLSMDVDLATNDAGTTPSLAVLHDFKLQMEKRGATSLEVFHGGNATDNASEEARNEEREGVVVLVFDAETNRINEIIASEAFRKVCAGKHVVPICCHNVISAGLLAKLRAAAFEAKAKSVWAASISIDPRTAVLLALVLATHAELLDAATTDVAVEKVCDHLIPLLIKGERAVKAIENEFNNINKELGRKLGNLLRGPQGVPDRSAVKKILDELRLIRRQSGLYISRNGDAIEGCTFVVKSPAEQTRREAANVVGGYALAA